MTTTTYRVDFADDDGAPPAVFLFRTDRVAAMTYARRVSRRRIGLAYVIRSDDGADVGQRVYIDGVFSHQDEVF